MKALTISSHGGLDRIEFRDDMPTPELRADTDVRIRVRAVGLNHLDLFVIAGLPGSKIDGPWILGSDAAGVVDAVGSAVRGISKGDPVLVNPGISDGTCEYCRAGEQSLCIKYGILGEHRPGTLAELIVVPAKNVRSIAPPDSWPQAGAFPLATMTAWRMVHTKARVQKGEHALIWGIGGGVALAVLQMCHQIGARTWVVSSSEDKLARAKALGADELIHRTSVDVGRYVREKTGKRGVDVVFDNVGAATWKDSLIALGKRGRLVTCGATSGPMVETDVRRLFWNQWTIMGSTMANDAEFDAIVDEYRRGRLRLPVDSTHDLRSGRAAFERLASGEQFGKVVITL